MAFEIVGETSINHLDDRERAKGDYDSFETTFYPRDGLTSPFKVTVYQAKEDNPKVFTIFRLFIYSFI